MSGNGEFVISAVAEKGFPKSTLPEIAFVGKSNVGKSSLLNKLSNIKKLARVSNTPGRTRAVNWFRVVNKRGKEVHFVDLPGYGYAKVSKSMKKEWGPLIESYLTDRSALKLVLLLLDIRRGVSEEEEDFVLWLQEQEIDVAVVLTKSDKLAKNKRKPVAMKVKRDLSLRRMPVLSSATKGDGMDDIWRLIGKALEGGVS